MTEKVRIMFFEKVTKSLNFFLCSLKILKEKMSDYDDYDDFEDEGPVEGSAKQPHQHISPQMLDKFKSKLNFEVNPNLYVEKTRETIELNDLKRKNLKPGKDMRRTEEQVLDNRTKVVLFKLLDQKILGDIEGCINTGKEGNIYIGRRGENAPEDWPDVFAVKIFKTAILKFKDRARYVNGEMRFQHHAKSKNSRKAVILWSEKEFRNLSRLFNKGVLCPRPLLVKHNIIFMELITVNNKPAPTLRLADLSQSQYKQMYADLCKNLRYIYHTCGLVHADLSEYNLLVKRNDLYIIDVGQAVETDNNNANVFLRNDISVITRFFKSHGVKTAPLMRLFEFIVEPELYTDEDEAFKSILDMEETMSPEEFIGVFIPQRLDQVADPELEIMDLEDGNLDQAVLHAAFTGVLPSELAPIDESLLKMMMDGEEDANDEEDEGDEENDDNDDADEDEEDEEEDGEKKEKKETLDRKKYTKAEWKEIQKQIKAERKQKRLTKKPKYLKRKAYRKSHPNAK